MTMVNLQISELILTDDGLPPVDGMLLEGAAQATLDLTGSNEGADLSLVLTGDAQLHELNRQYLGVDAPTDVLSFPAGEIDPETGLIYLGDVIISYQRAQAQAAAGGHPVEDELQLLVVHGVLHLLGRDHAEEIEKVKMWAEQSAILSRLGCSITSPQE
jgi:probable rRNA maturation factor